MMQSTIDRYIVATLAIWAGDIDHGRDILREIAPLHKYGKLPDEVRGPEELIRYTAALRYRQLMQRKKEYNNIVRNYRTVGFDLTSAILTVETRHLRGVIWRLDAREFEMYAYLTDLSWESNLFKKAKALISRFGEEKLPPYPGSGKEVRTKHFIGSSGSWIIRGNPFLQIHISDLGLIEARALWVKKELPKDAAQIKKTFSSILRKLDEKGMGETPGTGKPWRRIELV